MAAFNAQEAQVVDLKALLADAKAHDAAKATAELAKLKASSAPINRQFDALGLTTYGSDSSTAA